MPSADARLDVRRDVPLAPLTSLGVGGAARWYIAAASLEDVVRAREWALDRQYPIVVLGGGTNVVVADRGIEGLVLKLDLRGREETVTGDELRVEAAAGEPWDPVVGAAVAAGFGGLECLSGIPGSVGGTPIQNVGAYGQEVCNAIEHVRAVDCVANAVVELTREECGFGYRTSRFKAADAGRFIVTHVAFRLTARAATAVYPDVVAWIDRAGVRSPSPADVRRGVLEIRRGKGMVLDEADPDTRSVGSFFMNPIVSEATHAALTRDHEAPPGFRLSPDEVKVPAAWLIERAGFTRGYGTSGAGLSTKHPLAIVNRGQAAARDVVDLAVTIKRAVADRFGIHLMPEPVFVGFDEDDTLEFLLKASG